MIAPTDDHIATTSDERLIMMANQIARFFASQPGDAAAQGVAAHLKAYWDPRMRSRIVGHLAAGGAGLDAVARAGVAALEG